MYAANKLQIWKLLFVQQWLLGIDKFTLFTTLNVRAIVDVVNDGNAKYTKYSEAE